MKKRVVGLALCVALALGLVGCASNSDGSGNASEDSSGEYNTYTAAMRGGDGEGNEAAIPDEPVPGATGGLQVPGQGLGATRLQIYPAHEPPPSAEAQQVAVPEFLEPEQQALYRRAWQLANHFEIFPMGMANFEDLEGQRVLEKPVQYIPADWDEEHMYYYAGGRYRNWVDFEAMIWDIFTEDCFETLNETGDGEEKYFEVNGWLVITDGARGSNTALSGVPDEFELVEQSEDRIEFNVIGHYCEQGDDESLEEYMQRREAEYDYTESRPMRFVKEGGSWRVDVFNITR